MSNLNINEICFNETGVDIDDLPETPKHLNVFGYITFISCSIWFPFCLAIFFYFRSKPGSKYINLKKRNGFLVAFHNIGLMGICLLFGALNFIGNENFPCIYLLTLGIAFLVIIVDSYICRVLSFYFRVRFNQSLIKTKYEEIHARTRVESVAVDVVETPYVGVEELEVGTQGINFLSEEIKREDEENEKAKDVVQSRRKVKARMKEASEIIEENDFTFAIFEETSSAVQVRSGKDTLKSKSRSCTKNFILKVYGWKHNPLVPQELQFSFFLTSHRFNTTILFLLMALSLVTGIANVHSSQIEFNEINLNCVGCAPSADQQGAGQLVGFLAVLMVICSVFTLILRKYPDGLGVKEEIYMFAFWLVFYNFFFVVVPRFFLFSEVEIERRYDFSLLSVVEFTILGGHSTIYQVFKIHWKASNDNLSLENSLEKVLKTPQGTKAFAMFLSTNIAVEHLIFYKTVDKWENTFDKMSETRKSKVANDILSMFLTSKREMEVNVSGAMRNELKRKINDNDLSHDMFVQAKHEALMLMDNVFYDFTKSFYFHSINNGFIAEGANDI